MADYAKSTGLGSIIYPEVQKTLFTRMEDAKKGSLEGTSTRTVWARMTSGVAPNGNDPEQEGIFPVSVPVVMFAGVPDLDGGLRGGFDEIYGRDNMNFGQTITGYNDSANEFGEKYVPMAGITGITTSTEGELGALRKAKISWQCWSLEQLEFFEKFFMKLASTCMIEFGWSTGKLDDYTLYDVSTFEAAEKSIKAGIERGRKKTMESAGHYEVFSGLISNFEWSSNSGGGFDCETEIMSHGEPMVGARTNDSPQTANSAEDPKEVDPTEEAEKELESRMLNNLQKYLNNIDEEMDRFLSDKGYDTDTNTVTDDSDGTTRTFYPGGSSATKQHKTYVVDIRGWNDMNQSNVFFVTWGWMEDNILSKYMGRASKDYKMKYTIRSRNIVGFNGDKAEYESVRVSCNPILLEQGCVADARIATIPDNNPRYYAYRKNSLFRKVLDFLVPARDGERAGFEDFEVPDSDGKEGYLRNILINTDTIYEAFADVNTLTEGLEKLFDKINEAFFGIFDFKISVDEDNPTNIKIIDAGFYMNNIYDLIRNPSFHEQQQDGSFNSKFDSAFILPSMKASNNIVIEQSMNSKIPTEGMYAAMAGANRPSETPDPVDENNATGANVQVDKGLTDFLLYGFNIPDAFSRHNTYGQSEADSNKDLGKNNGPPITEYAKTDRDEDWWTEQKNANKSNPTKGEEDEFYDSETGELKSKEDYEDEQGWFSWLGDVISGAARYVGLAESNTISQDEILPSYMRKYYANRVKFGDGPKKKGTLGGEVLTPLEISFTLDGIAGIFPGNIIHTDYLPKKYKNKTALLITSVEHELNLSGWTTKLGTTMVAAYNQDKYGSIEPVKKADKSASSGTRLNEIKEERKRKRLEKRRETADEINQQDISSQENLDQSLIYDTPTQEDGNMK